ncbi:MAG: L-seryl-tRNA(Sec) selenium transferase [Planctomycetes bacterium]|nr:L-seryl-tRNA(Sec) selenium transferase [Planctomycetota bacterium]
MDDGSVAEALRLLPKVDALLADAAFGPVIGAFGRALVTDAVRADLQDLRGGIACGTFMDEVEPYVLPEACAERARRRLEAQHRVRCGRALNATGVVLHTGLGRAPLGEGARRALLAASGFAVVEVDRATGQRGHRDEAVAALLRELTGAEAATVVNNNAAATLITLAALAAGRPVIVSRGQLVEIGGSFRIPDVMAQSGARLVEVGTTNRTHLADYERALDAHPDAALLLRVHTSNFRVVGFTSEVPTADLVALGRRRGVQVMDDLGSGSFVDLAPHGLPHEPRVQDSVAAGAGVVTFSGDKLLGGPQAGLVVGRRDLVEQVRRHPLYRALRPDKLTLAALEATLVASRDPARAAQELPALGMIAAPLEALEARAHAIARALVSALPSLVVAVVEGASKVGGGSYAVEALPTRLVAVAPPAGWRLEVVARRLRERDPAVFARLHDDRLVLDPRTLLGPDEDREVVEALVDVLRR